jgi:putative ATPase
VEQGTLFGGDAVTAQPLAARVRPQRFEDLVGQAKVVGLLRDLAQAGRLPSLILWGPPGSGKTTLARLLATGTQSHFESLSAVGSGVADIRRVIAQARHHRGLGQPTVLFIDELHRFNKAQQDSILPHVEDGTVTLIGATTENPSFEVISPLLSRVRVFRLQALTEADLDLIITRGLAELNLEIAAEARAVLVSHAQGDGRVALNLLELAADLQSEGPISTPAITQALAGGHHIYDRAGDQHYQIVSALIKSVRGSDPDAAVYWLARMLEAGEDVMFVARRLVILAAEDVGLADPAALSVAVAAQQAAHFVGLPEAVLPLTEAAIYLALAPKSNSAMVAYSSAKELIERTGSLPVPLHLRNASTSLERGLGYGQGYQYAHDSANGVATQAHLPPEVENEVIYRPRELGAEVGLSAAHRARGRPSAGKQ